jgi:hypothetical protein
VAERGKESDPTRRKREEISQDTSLHSDEPGIPRIDPG